MFILGVTVFWYWLEGVRGDREIKMLPLSTLPIYHHITWNTVCILWENVSKLDIDTLWLDVQLRCIWRDGNLPPKSWEPSSAKIPRNRKSRTRRDTIASILFVRDTKRFCNFLQYLKMMHYGTKGIMEKVYKAIHR